MAVLDEILKKDFLMSCESGRKIAGFIYLRTYQELPTKNGGTYIAGKAECIGAIDIKVWNGPIYTQMKEVDFSNKICCIHAEVNEFNGLKSLIISHIHEYEGDELIPDLFFARKYDVDEVWNGLHNILTRNCTADGVAVFDLCIDPIKDRFMKEYAAIGHHDACMNGLLAHSRKVTGISQIVKWYPNITRCVDKDLLYVSAALHDIGKVLEYNNGTITEAGKVMSHLTLGLDLIRPYHDRIVELKGEDFYLALQSVIQQHHGEYGERPRTLAAYLIHIFDILESQLTDIDEILDQTTSDQIRLDGCFLSFKKN